MVSAESRDDYDAGDNPITLGSIGYRGNGTLWSSNTASASQRLTGLVPFGAGDVVMFVLDPVTASLWIGRNGLWRDDPASASPTWIAAASPAFFPFVQGRDPGDGGTLRSLPSAFGHPVPPGTRPLGFDEPDLRIYSAAAWIERDPPRDLTLAGAETWIEHGGSAPLTAVEALLFVELGGSAALTVARANLYIELET